MRIYLVLKRVHLLQRKLMQLLVQARLHGRVALLQVIDRLYDALHLLRPLRGRRGGFLNGGDDAPQRLERRGRDHQPHQKHQHEHQRNHQRKDQLAAAGKRKTAIIS